MPKTSPSWRGDVENKHLYETWGNQGDEHLGWSSDSRFSAAQQTAREYTDRSCAVTCCFVRDLGSAQTCCGDVGTVSLGV